MERVQEILQLESSEEAETTVEAALSTLGERLSTPQRTHLASQLPGELKRLLFRRQRTRRFPLEDFYKRVGSRSNVGFRVAVDRARAVMRVLQEAVSPGERKRLIDELPDEYRELFPEETTGPHSTSI